MCKRNKAFLLVLSLILIINAVYFIPFAGKNGADKNETRFELAAEYPKTINLYSLDDPSEENKNTSYGRSPKQPRTGAYSAEELTVIAARYTPIPLDEEEKYGISDIQPGSISPAATEPIGTGEGAYAFDENPYGAILISTAQHYLGIPYVAAGQEPSVGFDCSGYVSYVYNRCGIAVRSKSCSGIYQEAVRVLKPSAGDIVFFVNPETRSSLTHVGIYIGNNKMIHAGTSGICYTDLSISYWQARIYGYGRIVSEDAGSEAADESSADE